VTLEVAAGDAEKVEVAGRIGRLSLAVRSSEPGSAAASADSKTGPTWASDVSNALASKTQTQGPSVMKVFNGAGQGQEFKF
jgi:pilus assembly protein CpaB